METSNLSQDGCQQTNKTAEVPTVEEDKQVHIVPPGGEAVAKKKKTRRRKSKRKLNKPYTKMPWYQRRNPIAKKINRNRKILMAQSNLHAPYNTNQFLMEVHRPEAEGVFQMLKAPSARTRDSSFSVDSEENYFFSLPEDEEDFLTKEFSSVYEDAQSERLANMTKEELVEQNILLEAKVEALTKRIINTRTVKTEDVSMSTTNSECDLTKKIDDLTTKLREHEDKIRELQTFNETLRLENECLKKRSGAVSSSEDSESDSSSSSSSSSSSDGGDGDSNMKCDGVTIENINNASPQMNGYAVSPEYPEMTTNRRELNGDNVVTFNGHGESNGGNIVIYNGDGEIETDMEQPSVSELS